MEEAGSIRDVLINEGFYYFTFGCLNYKILEFKNNFVFKVIRFGFIKSCESIPNKLKEKLMLENKIVIYSIETRRGSTVTSLSGENKPCCPAAT